MSSKTINTISIIKRKVTFQIALGFFLLAALLGTLMRYLYLFEISFLDYKHVLHAHSHLAMLGWGFTVLAGALVFALIPHQSSKKEYKFILIANLIAGTGMFFSFLYQGYGALSIFFCTLHIIAVYFFARHYLKDIKNYPASQSIKFANWSIYWLLISTIGLWSIAPISIFLTKLHPLYFASIQFFLHFQFNGWFIYGLLALLFAHSEKNGYSVKLPKGTFVLLQLSLLLTYTLSVTWSTPEYFLFYINSFGVLLQLLAFSFLWIGFTRGAGFSLQNSNFAHWLLRLGVLSLALKVIVQSAVAIPFVAKVSYTIRNFVIGFIHLTMLGGFSLTIIALLLYNKYLPLTKLSKNGYRLLILGFTLSEALLFLQGIFLWAGEGFLPNYHELIFGATLLLPLALVLINISILKFNSNKPI